jgi:transposase
MQTHPISYPTDLTDEKWDQIESLVPAAKYGQGKRGRPTATTVALWSTPSFYVVLAGCAFA